MKRIRYIPYGYTVRNGRTVIDRDEAAVIRSIYEDYINGASLKEIAADLTSRGIPYTEKTSVWDKARVARIIENARYVGDGEYDPIIDEETYEGAVTAKTARQRNTVGRECGSIALLRNRVKCGKCGAPMVRRISGKQRVRESWVCSDPACGCRCRISDGDLLARINLLINRVIANSELMIQKPKVRTADPPVIAGLQRQIDLELTREHPSEQFIIGKTAEIASQLYRESNAKQIVLAQIARRRVSLMKPGANFNDAYFSDIAAYVTLDENGRVTLHTKVNTEISEGVDDDGCNEDPEEDRYTD